MKSELVSSFASQSAAPSSSSHQGPVIGGAVGGSVVTCLLAIGAWYCWRRQKRSDGVCLNPFGQGTQQDVVPFDGAIAEQFRLNVSSQSNNQPRQMSAKATSTASRATSSSNNATSSSDMGIRRELEELRTQMEELRAQRMENLSHPPEYRAIDYTPT
jgi:hypothetical protein